MIVVSTTTCAAFMDDPYTWGSWLATAEELIADSVEPVRFFAALELDARGIEPFKPLIHRLEGLGGTYWTYSFDDGRDTVSTANRISHITIGQNIQIDYALRTGAEWTLFLAADLRPPEDAISKLLEVKHPVVGGECPTYCLNGVTVPGYSFPVQQQKVATAAFFMVHRDVFRQIRWRYDPDLGLTDDPAYCRDVRELLGIPVFVRKDCVGKHYPEAIGPVETRGHDLSVAR